MHYWESGQILALLVLNFTTWVSYDVIPLCWHSTEKKMRAQGVKFVPVFVEDFYLTRAFIFLCGKHHMVMLPCMMWSKGYDVYYFTVLGVDFMMTAVSVVCAVRALLQRFKWTPERVEVVEVSE